MSYMLAIDQSTSGSKAILFDGDGISVNRYDLPHEQKISAQGWVSHDPVEIYNNTLNAVKGVIKNSGIAKSAIAGVGISNQRETALVWNRVSGLPVMDAVVWQCNRGQAICDRLAEYGDIIRQKTGLPLSPYFSASKIAWLLETVKLPQKNLCAGTIDSWLIYKLTGGRYFATEYSNASRTQLCNIYSQCWDSEICGYFNIDPRILPEIRDSDGYFGETDFEGYFDKPIPIFGVLGDSQAALFGQGCNRSGMVKATYGTGSSVMMNIGPKPVQSNNNLAISIAWRMNGCIDYVLEGNINYSCAVIKWLVDELGLLATDRDAGEVARTANLADSTYLVPAFSGLGAPYWKPEAKAYICGMTRITGKAEIVRAAEECIAYQIADVIDAMIENTDLVLDELRTDGGASRDSFLMQFQSDILDIPVKAAYIADLSAYGSAVMAGISLGVYPKTIIGTGSHVNYLPNMPLEFRAKKRGGWQDALTWIK